MASAHRKRRPGDDRMSTRVLSTRLSFTDQIRFDAALAANGTKSGDFIRNAILAALIAKPSKE